MSAPAFALLTLLPMIVGPLPAAEPAGAVLTARLCNGGTIEIPVGGGENRHDLPGQCTMKACHSGPCRKRLI
ncbi:hypothetical protein [Qipengyuania sp. YIM B01966]|uniref:hypothetical protein n=1 Tax=Qipengyuania sp. YIM B01966 TaxID=2778646 RepID=UPI0018F28A49|nr:hypothetical protein [Qipengyuania sp. YIM B01966]